MKVKFKVQGEYKPFERTDVDFNTPNKIILDNKEYLFYGNVFTLELEYKCSSNSFTTTDLLDTAATLLQDVKGVYPKSVKLQDGFEIIDLEKYEDNEYKFSYNFYINRPPIK